MNRRIALSIGALALITASGCSGSWYNADNLATYEASLTPEVVGQAESISIETKTGDVLLEPTAGEPKVVGKIRARTQERADATTISTIINGDILEISVNWPNGKRKNSESCDLLVYVPAMTGIGIDIDAAAGNIFVKDMAGPINIQSSAGNIEVRNHNGGITARTSAGNIDFWDVADAVDVKTNAGDISLRRVGAPALAKTSAGDVYVVLHADATGALEASTSAGKVSLLGTKFKSKNGSVSITDDGPTSRFKTIAGDVEVSIESQ